MPQTAYSTQKKTRGWMICAIIALVLVVALALCLSYGGATLKSTQTNLGDTQQKLEDTQTELYSTKTALTTTQNDLTAAQNTLDATSAELAAAKDAQTAAAADLTAAQDALTAKESELAAAENPRRDGKRAGTDAGCPRHERIADYDYQGIAGGEGWRRGERRGSTGSR